MTDRSNLILNASIAAAVSGAAPLPPGKPPADSPIETGWNKFNALAVPVRLVPDIKRLLQHAFYAGARVTRLAIIDGLTEMASDDADTAAKGEERLASIEIEVEKYFAEISRRLAISPDLKR